MATDITYAKSIFTLKGYFKTSGVRKLQKLHAELGSPIASSLIPGDVVRIQPNHISFNTEAAIEDIHGMRTTLRKGEPYLTVFGSKTGVRNVFSAMYISQLLS